MPQPIGWIAQILVIESWPTFREVEIQWIAWALGAVGLVVLALAGRRKQESGGLAWPVLSVLGIASGVLVTLVAVRAAFSGVPLVAMAWTWQLSLALLWMLAMYVWTVRLAASRLAAAMAVSISVLCGISLLFCIQAKQWYPNWPVGNVLLLTSSCLAGVFLLAAWGYNRFAYAARTGRPWDYAVASVPAVMLAVVTVILSMSGRRAAVLGIVGGLLFVAIAWLLLRRQARRVTWRVKLGVAAGLVTLAAGTMLSVPRLFHRGRWESVLLARRCTGGRRSCFSTSRPPVGLAWGLGSWLSR